QLPQGDLSPGGAARHRSGTIGPVAASRALAHDRAMPSRAARRPHARRLAALAAAAAFSIGSIGSVVARDAPTTGTRDGFSLSCPVLPATNVWNRRVDALPVRSDSAI